MSELINRSKLEPSISEPSKSITGIELASSNNPAFVDEDLAQEIIVEDNLLATPYNNDVYGDDEIIKISGSGADRTENNNLDELGQLVAHDNKIICQACHKTFATKGSLTRHEDRNPLCVKWQTEANKLFNPEPQNILDLLADVKKKVLNGDFERTYCRYCKNNYKTRQSLYRHFETSTMCNKYAYDTFLKTMSTN